MFLHILKYRLRVLFREKQGLFWTLFFPIMLSTLFYFAFGNINVDNNIEKVDIAVIDSDIVDANFLTTMKESNLFNITQTNEEEAKELLEKNDIKGYISYEDNIKLTVKSTGLSQTITKSFLDEYAQITSTITTIATTNPQANIDELVSSLESEQSYIENKPINESNDPMVVYYYALIAMTCLYAACYGCYEIINVQANQSKHAARICVAPTHKLKVFLSSISASIVLQFASILMVLGYISCVLKIDFGDSMGYVILLSLVGVLTGMTFGTAVSALIKTSENVKMGIIISTIMLFSFFAGLMSIDVKSAVQAKFPLISYLNPANLITDGFLSLYYYDSLNIYFLNLGILSGLTVVFSVATYFVLRRQKYASI